MRDVYQVMQEKELEIVRVQQEIHALRTVLPLLVDEKDDDAPLDGPSSPPLQVMNRE
jgi:hypothetical protein